MIPDIYRKSDKLTISSVQKIHDLDESRHALHGAFRFNESLINQPAAVAAEILKPRLVRKSMTIFPLELQLLIGDLMSSSTSSGRKPVDRISEKHNPRFYRILADEPRWAHSEKASSSKDNHNERVKMK